MTDLPVELDETAGRPLPDAIEGDSTEHEHKPEPGEPRQPRVEIPVQMPKPPPLVFDDLPVPPSPRTVQNLRRRGRVIE